MTDKDEAPAPEALIAKPDRIADLVYFLRSRDLEIPEFHALQLEIADALVAQADRIKELERILRGAGPKEEHCPICGLTDAEWQARKKTP